MLSEENVNRHMVEDGDGGPLNADEILMCPVEGCAKQFKWKKNLQVHIRVNHMNPGAYACTFEGCGLSFGYKHVLARHVQLIHVEGRRHRSTLAITRSIMGSAMKPFTGKRRLDLDENDPDAVARAVAAAMVDEGRKQASAIVPCMFEGCDKTFKGNSNMKAHYRVAHMTCPVIDCTEPTCGAKFSYRHVMLRHYDNIHVKGKRSRMSIITKREMESGGTNKAGNTSSSSSGNAALHKNNGSINSRLNNNYSKNNHEEDEEDDDDDGSVSSNGSDVPPAGRRHLEGSNEIPGLRGLNGGLVMNVNTINAAAAGSVGVPGGMVRNNNIQLYTNRLEAQFLQHPQQQQQQQDYSAYLMSLDQQQQQQLQQQQQQQQQQPLPSLQSAAGFNNSGAMLLQHQAAMLSSNYQPIQVLSYQHTAQGGGNAASQSGESV